MCLKDQTPWAAGATADRRACWCLVLAGPHVHYDSIVHIAHRGCMYLHLYAPPRAHRLLTNIAAEESKAALAVGVRPAAGTERDAAGALALVGDRAALRAAEIVGLGSEAGAVLHKHTHQSSAREPKKASA